MTARKLLTLVFIRDAGKILLGMKKRGFGAGKWNGFGGKVESGETILQGAARELKEECGIVSKHLKNIGLLEFEFEGDPMLLEVHVFSTTLYDGEPTETEEMRPQWFSEADIPFKMMWPDDSIWLPVALQGHRFKGYFLYRGDDTILSHTLNLLD